MSAARRTFRPVRSTAFAVWSVSAVSLACSGGGGTDVARAGDVITGAEDLGRIEGRVTIGPLCPVERIPPDPTCQPTPETFAAVKILILDAAGAVLRQVDLDGEGRYSVELDPGAYLVDTTWPDFGEGGGDPVPGDSGSSGGGSGIGEPGDDGSVGGGQDDPPPTVIDSSGTGVEPGDPGAPDPGMPGRPGVPTDPVEPPGPGVPPDPGFPPDPSPPDDPGNPPPPCDPFCEPPPPCDAVWPMDPGGADGVAPAGDAPTVVDSTGCGGPGFPGEPPEPFPGDSVFPDSSFPGDTAAPPPFPLPFPNDSLAEGPPPDGEAVPQHLLPVEVVLQPGETQRLDIDIDTGIR